MGDIFIFARAVAFAPRADFPAAAELVFLGAPVVGFLEPPPGEAASPQLIGARKSAFRPKWRPRPSGWSKTIFDAWRTAAHTSLPDPPMRFQP